jgi:hypothetical protein
VGGEGGISGQYIREQKQKQLSYSKLSIAMETPVCNLKNDELYRILKKRQTYLYSHPPEPALANGTINTTSPSVQTKSNFSCQQVSYHNRRQPPRLASSNHPANHRTTTNSMYQRNALNLTSISRHSPVKLYTHPPPLLIPPQNN